MTKKIRLRLSQIKAQKHVRFSDLDPLVRKCLQMFEGAFPQQSTNRSGSRVVYHFNAGDLAPVSLEREHGSREYIPRPYVKLAVRALEDALSYVESLPMPSERIEGDDDDHENPREES